MFITQPGRFKFTKDYDLSEVIDDGRTTVIRAESIVEASSFALNKDGVYAVHLRDIGWVQGDLPIVEEPGFKWTKFDPANMSNKKLYPELSFAR